MEPTLIAVIITGVLSTVNIIATVFTKVKCRSKCCTRFGCCDCISIGSDEDK